MFVKTLAEIGENTSNRGLARAALFLILLSGFLWFLVKVLNIGFSVKVG